MARKHAMIYSSIWSNPDFLKLSEGSQRLFFVLLSQPDLNLCGVATVRPKLWARLASDSTPMKISRSVSALDAAGFVIFDGDTDEVAVRSFLRYEKILRTPNTFKGMCRSFGTIHSKPIQASVLRQVPCHMRAGFPDEFVNAHPKTLGELLREPFPEPLEEPFQKGLGEGLAEPLANGMAEPLKEPLVRAIFHRSQVTEKQL